MVTGTATRMQIILAGVGGQGILFSSKIFSELGQKLGLEIMGSETHGMSQRGGSVIAHLKLGKFLSPLIHTGAADLLYSFDLYETYRTLRFLRRGGICFANLLKEDQIDRRILSHLQKKEIIFRAWDASGLASRLGSIRAANIVLIGYSAGTGLVPFQYDDLRDVLKIVSRGKDIKRNLKAFDAGFQEGSRHKI
jgi:indolepyruvate ferredoxin oxidoreductase beta subunit